MNKIPYTLSIFFSLLLFSACQSESDLQIHLNDTDWVGTHFDVTMPSHRNSDSTFVVKADKNNWESVLQGKPSKIHLKSNGDYNEEHFNLNDDRILNYEGTWSIEVSSRRVVDGDGDIWYYNEDGELHREDGPAVVYRDGTKFWYRNGELHKEDGPAVIWYDGSMEWWLDGEEYSEEEYMKEVLIRKSKILEVLR